MTDFDENADYFPSLQRLTNKLDPRLRNLQQAQLDLILLANTQLTYITTFEAMKVFCGVVTEMKSHE